MRKVCSISRATLTTFILLLSGASTVEADSDRTKLLKGDFNASINVNCAVDTAGFDANNDFQRLGGGFTFSAVLNGVFHYNGDGTGTFAHDRLRVIHGFFNNAAQKPVFHAIGNCDVNYSVDKNGGLTQTLNNCTSTDLQGTPTPADTLEESQIQLNGSMGLAGRYLLFGGTELEEETVILLPVLI